MGYTLILTEKPTASQKIAEALAEGEVKKMQHGKAPYYRITRKGREIVVVPAVGHLFILADAESSRWTYPKFEVKWQTTFSEKNNKWAKAYYDNIVKISKGATDFISATDFDVEGSVIAYNIFRFVFKTEKGKRMKFSTLTKPDITEAYENASNELDFPQIEAGLARHQLDWYFGINLTRALTLALEHSGGYWTLSTGRVQGPTLKILDERQREIKSFKPVPFWELELQGKLNGKKIVGVHSEDKFWEKEKAAAAMERSKGKKAVVEKVERKQVRQNPPFPFDLTSLQREAYSLFGYSPKMTLDVAQTLYEAALISYPRTSSQKLPERLGCKEVLKNLESQADYSESCRKILSGREIKPNEGQKTDPAHPAIYPTGTAPAKLNPYQKKVYDLIVRRFLAVFGSPAVREQMRVTIDAGGEKFFVHGIRTLEANWIDLYKPYGKFKEEILPEVKKGDVVDPKKIAMLDKETQPPSRYTQASILKEMESLGLGTKATRAQILQTLYDRGYIKEKSILVTELGEAVVEALEKYCSEIISPELTKKFDEEMEAIESGEKKREMVVLHAEEHLQKILKRFKENERKIGAEILKAVKNFEKEEHRIGKCPKCGNELKVMHSHRTKKRFVGCSGYPKCSNSFPLPQNGKLEVTSKTCKNCGLNIVMISKYGRRPWRLCVKCDFEESKRKAAEAADKKAAEQKMPPETKAKPVPVVVQKPEAKSRKKTAPRAKPAAKQKTASNEDYLEISY